ncbi:MAG: AAA family ATPase, partial [Pseudomonadota bacterium]
MTISDTGGAPDQASRAARCALAMRHYLPSIPIMLATGKGQFSTRTVVGDVLDRGVGSLRKVVPGAIRLDETTASLLDSRFEVSRVDDTIILTGERDVAEGSRRLLGKTTPFVGRTRELSALTSLFSSCIEESIASVALVAGPPGAGKTRLRQAFLDWVSQRGEPATLLFGTPDALGTGSPFGMLGHALRRSAGIRDDEPLESRRAKLAKRVGKRVSSDVLPRVASFLGELAGAPFPDETCEALRAARRNPLLMADGARTAWEDWLGAECSDRPVLLILEDIHWGDQATIEFVDAALRHLQEQPFMVLALGRPEVFDRFPSIWRERQLQTINLGPLPRKASEKLVKDVLGPDVDAAIVARIVERADGNAFFLEELIRAVSNGQHDDFPDTVLGIVQTRLDAEGSEAKRVLRAASVFGSKFSSLGVTALLGDETQTETETSSEWLEHLADRELLARASLAADRKDPEYTFRHDLVREAAYAMLTDDDRVLGHRLAGDWLERAGHSDAITLAEHFRRGGELGRCVPWYLRAAQQALGANDLGAAIERAQRGRDSFEETLESEERIRLLGSLLLVQAEAHVWRGELSLAEERGRIAATSLPPGSAAWFSALAQLTLSAGKLGHLDQIEACIEEAKAATPDEDAKNDQIVCLCRAADFLLFGGRYAATDALIERIESLAMDPEVDRHAMALVHELRSFRASVKGDPAAALQGLVDALAAFDATDDRRNACSVRTNLGFIYSELGDYQSAEDSLRGAIAAADRMGLHELSAVALHNLGHVLAYRGQLAEARVLEQRAIEAFKKQGDQRLEGVAWMYLAKAALFGCDFATAEKEARTAVQILAACPSLRASALAVLGQALLGQNRAKEALAVAEQAHAELEALGAVEEGESLIRLTRAEAIAAASAQSVAGTTSTAGVASAGSVASA